MAASASSVPLEEQHEAQSEKEPHDEDAFSEGPSKETRSREGGLPGSNRVEQRRKDRAALERERPTTLPEVIQHIRGLAPQTLEGQGKQVNVYVEAISRLLDGVRVEEFPDAIRAEVSTAIESWHRLDKVADNLDTLVRALDLANAKISLSPEPSAEAGQPAESSAATNKSLQPEKLVTADSREIELRREHREITAQQAVAARTIVNEARTVASLRAVATAAEQLEGSELIDYVTKHITSEQLINARSQAVDILQKRAPESNLRQRLSRHYKPDIIQPDPDNPEEWKFDITWKTSFYTLAQLVERMPAHAVGDVAAGAAGVLPAAWRSGKHAWQGGKRLSAAGMRRLALARERKRVAGTELIADVAEPYQVVKIDGMIDSLRKIGFLDERRRNTGSALEQMGKSEPGIDTRPGMRTIIRTESLRRTETQFANGLIANKIDELDNDVDHEAMRSWLETNGKQLNLDSFEKVETMKPGTTNADASNPEASQNAEPVKEISYELKTTVPDENGKNIVIRLTAQEMQALQDKVRKGKTGAVEKEMGQDALRTAIQAQIKASGNEQLATWFQQNSATLTEDSLEMSPQMIGVEANAKTEYQLKTGVKGTDEKEIVLSIEGQHIDRAKAVAQLVVDHSSSLRAAARFWLRQSGDQGLAQAGNFHSFNVEMQHDGTMIIDVLTQDSSRLVAPPDQFTNQVIGALKDRSPNAEMITTAELTELWGKSDKGGKRGKRAASETAANDTDTDGADTDEPKTEIIDRPAVNDTDADTGGTEEFEDQPATPEAATVATTATAEAESGANLPTIDDAARIILNRLTSLRSTAASGELAQAIALVTGAGGAKPENLTVRLGRDNELIIGARSGNTIDQTRPLARLSKDTWQNLLRGTGLATEQQAGITQSFERNKIATMMEEDVEELIQQMPASGASAGPAGPRVSVEADPGIEADMFTAEGFHSLENQDRTLIDALIERVGKDISFIVNVDAKMENPIQLPNGAEYVPTHSGYNMIHHTGKKVRGGGMIGYHKYDSRSTSPQESIITLPATAGSGESRLKYKIPVYDLVDRAAAKSGQTARTAALEIEFTAPSEVIQSITAATRRRPDFMRQLVERMAPDLLRDSAPQPVTDVTLYDTHSGATEAEKLNNRNFVA